MPSVQSADKSGAESSNLSGVEKAHGEQFDDETTESTIDPSNAIVGIKLLMLHIGLCLCNLLVGLDFTIIATSVPVITSRFHSIEDVGWYGGAFYLTMCATQPFSGKLLILFPKRVIYLLYVAIFEIGSLICALSPNSKALIVGRAVAGLGASGIFAGGLVVLATVVPLHKRAVWQGTLQSTFAVASVVGPVIGGALTQHVTWRWCFYLNLPIGGASALLVLVFLNVKPSVTEGSSLAEKIKQLDFIGFALFAGAVIMLLLPLQWGGTTYPWNSATIIGLFVGSGITIPLFVAWQQYQQDSALIPPKIFAQRNVPLICLSALFANGPFQTVVYWLPIWFQAVLGASPTSSGVRYLPTVISDVLTSIIASGIVMKLGIWNPFLLAGVALMSIGSGLLTTLHPGITEGHWIGFQILSGIGYSLTMSIAHLGVQASLPKELVPLGATTLLFAMSTSCAVFLAVGQAVFQERLITNLGQVLPPQTVRQILSLGATQIRAATSSENTAVIVSMYSNAVTQVFYIPAAGPVLSFFILAFAKWTSLK